MTRLKKNVLMRFLNHSWGRGFSPVSLERSLERGFGGIEMGMGCKLYSNLHPHRSTKEIIIYIYIQVMFIFVTSAIVKMAPPTGKSKEFKGEVHSKRESRLLRK